jgi:hypothetical protein
VLHARGEDAGHRVGRHAAVLALDPSPGVQQVRST